MNMTIAKLIHALLIGLLAVGIHKGLQQLSFFKQAKPWMRFLIEVVILFILVSILNWLWYP